MPVASRTVKFLWSTPTVSTALRAEASACPWLGAGELLPVPVAHGEGRFIAPEDDLRRIEDRGQVWLKYSKSPNGSTRDIAGLTNEAGNVAALMPHPERALFDWMGGTDGWSFL